VFSWLDKEVESPPLLTEGSLRRHEVGIEQPLQSVKKPEGKSMRRSKKQRAFWPPIEGLFKESKIGQKGGGSGIDHDTP